MKSGPLIALVLLISPARTPAQSPPPGANSVVKADSLPVHAEAQASSESVRTFKKGDALFVDLELKLGPEKWCRVRLPGEAARLGFVECDGLERTDKRSGDLALPADLPSSTGSSSLSADPAAAGASTPKSVRLPRARTAVESSTEFEKVSAAVVHDDILDGGKVAEYEQAARSGSASAMSRAAIAHIAAGNFELQHNDSEQALEQLRAALPFAAKQSNILFAALFELAYIHIVRSEYSAALDYLAQARQISPDSVAVARFSGWAYYGSNRITDAIKEWESAQRLQPDPQISSLLEKAKRDAGVEQQAREGGSSHFVLHYQGGATPQLANEIMRALEDHFRAIQIALHFTPAEPIGVILYTQQTFRDVTRAPSWVGALNDGRIRVPVQGLDSMNEELSRVLKHELTHSFVRQMTLGRCPTWLNEGVAQWMEGRRSSESAQNLVAMSDAGYGISLKKLEGPWTALPASAAAFAYAWSLAAVEGIAARSGEMTIHRLLTDLSKASSTEEALRESLQIGYPDLDRQTVEYLRETYAQ